MKIFQIYKVVREGRLMHIASIESENRIEAIKTIKKDYNLKIEKGLKFWNYYITGITQPFQIRVINGKIHSIQNMERL